METNSSGDHLDAVNDRQARLAADPALEPELAYQRDQETWPVKPPPPEGGWGYHPDYGWGYFPPQGELLPK